MQRGCAKNKIFRACTRTIELVGCWQVLDGFEECFSFFSYQLTLQISLQYFKIFQLFQDNKICPVARAQLADLQFIMCDGIQTGYRKYFKEVYFFCHSPRAELID